MQKGTKVYLFKFRTFAKEQTFMNIIFTRKNKHDEPLLKISIFYPRFMNRHIDCIDILARSKWIVGKRKPFV